MAQLDRSKPFAEVHGDDPRIGHRFEQGGKKFDHTGNEIGVRGQSAPKAAPTDKPEEQKKVDDNQINRQLSEV